MKACLSLLLAASAIAVPPAGGPTPAEALKLLGPAPNDPHAMSATWNGRGVVFVDYLDGPNQDEASRQLLVVDRAGSALRRVKVTEGEQEGGAPDIAAVAFVNADRDPAKELAVILRWTQIHYDVSGELFEVRLFDDLKPGATRLTPLTALSRHFGSGCECEERNGRKRHYRFQTVASVRRELVRLGY